jgi:glucose/arabinose dehydrogenase
MTMHDHTKGRGATARWTAMLAMMTTLATVGACTGGGDKSAARTDTLAGGSTRTGAATGTATGTTTGGATSGAATACAGDNGGITLAAGFCASVFADSVGHARHVVVAPNGDVYVNTWSGTYYPDKSVLPGGFIVALRDTNHDGKADVITRFGATAASGGRGGTGIALYHGSLYAEEGAQIVRYKLDSAGGAPTSKPETILSGMPLTGDHPMHPFAIDSSGALYVDMGSASNSCQLKNRTLQSPGHKPCTELATRGGIWMYDANTTGQHFSAAGRYATGIRNAVGIAFGPDGLYSTQHGRDQLAENWPKLYTAQQGQELPAEQLMKIEKGADYGWPTCYFDGYQKKLVLAPEYGGDGGKAVGDCASKRPPVAFFPAHWAPDGLLFYTGSAFPARYRNGAFIAFHGSWNRLPGPQGGYKVVFVPLTNGGSGPVGPDAFEVFADGFAAGKMQPDAAAHRPVGLAQGPDGALYIADDKGGRVWKVVAKGGR